jgi:hypothetical protein
MIRGSCFDLVHGEREEQGVQSRPEKRASKSTRDAGLVFGSQEIPCLPAGHVTTFASQSTANVLLSKPAFSVVPAGILRNRTNDHNAIIALTGYQYRGIVVAGVVSILAIKRGRSSSQLSARCTL